MKVITTLNQEEFDTRNIEFMAHGVSDDEILKEMKSLWNKICAARDGVEELSRFYIRSELDSTAHSAVVLSFNVNKFLEFVTYLANAYIPRLEGNKAIIDFYNSHIISMDRTTMAYSKTGKYHSIMQSSCGIFSFHFYPGNEWANMRLETAAGAGQYVPYDIMDYSVLMDCVRKCPKGARPMAWINPFIYRGFIEAGESDMDYNRFIIFASSLIITTAFNTTEGDVTDDMANQLWVPLKNFIDEGGPMSDLKAAYDNAENLLIGR